MEFREVKAAIVHGNERFRRFSGVWDVFKAALVENPLSSKVQEDADSYADIRQCGESEVRFSYLGYRWSIRFHHDLEKGILEYGALLTRQGPDPEFRLVKRIEFDTLGNVGTDENIGDRGPALVMHFRVMVEALPEFLRSRQQLSGGPAPEA